MVDSYVQSNPYCVQVELTEGCNLRCSFCGLNGIRGKKTNFKFMTVDSATDIAQGIAAEQGWNPRIEFAMHGEPTMNPNYEEIVSIFREALPKAYLLMESNGGGLVGGAAKKIMGLFNAGLSCLALDEYQDITLVPKIQAQLAEALRVDSLKNVKTVNTAAIHLYFYPASGPEGNPHQRSSKKRLVFISPIDLSTAGTHATLSNHAGSGGPRNDKAQGKRCAKPFREMNFRWDGSMAICCNDWRGTYVIGKVPDKGVGELWHDPRMYAARRKLYQGERDFGPCDGCDALSYRPGLLPDPRGKIDLEPANAADDAIIEAAMAEPPLTEPVIRPWEQKS